MRRHRAIGTILIVALSGFLMGFDGSLFTGAVGFIEAEFALSSFELGWAVTSMAVAGFGPRLCTVMVNVTGSPSCAVKGDTDFVNSTSASSSIAVSKVAWLFETSGSGVGVDTFAALTTGTGPT
jgi:SP family arabinose:H+ symporter-like MFS transporter